MENEELENDLVLDAQEADDWSAVEAEALEELGEESTPTDFSQDEYVEETETNEPVEDNKEEVSTPTDEFEVVYNGEKIKVSKDDAIPLIQKGMNYDKLNSKYENDKARDFVKRLAEAEGKSIDEYIELTDKSIKDFNIRQLADEENISEEVARELYESREAQKRTLASVEKENSSKEEQNKQFADFLSLYPNVKPEEIPAQVWQKYNEGTPLKYAYMEYENQTLKTNNKQLKTNATNMQQEIKVGNSNPNQKVKEDWELEWDED